MSIKMNANILTKYLRDNLMSPSFVAKNAGLTQAVVYRAMHGRNMQKQSVIKLLQGINLPIEEAREKGFLIER